MPTTVAAPAGATFIDKQITTGKDKKTVLGTAPVLHWNDAASCEAFYGSVSMLLFLNGTRSPHGAYLALASRGLTGTPARTTKKGVAVAAKPPLDSDGIATAQLNYRPGNVGGATPSTRAAKAAKNLAKLDGSKISDFLIRLEGMTEEQRNAILSQV